MADGKVTIEAILDSKKFKRSVEGLGGVTKKGLKVATASIAAAGTALGGLGLAAIKTGMSFESSFAGVKKTVNASDKQLAQFKQGIRDMAKEMPQSADAIASVAEAAGQLGIKNKNLMSFTRTMTMLGDATNLSSDEAATSLARLANITGMSQSKFGRLGSTIVALGNNLATTESEIVAMSMRIAGAGHQVGMTEPEIMAFAGALSSVGIEAEAGGTAFSSLISKMSLAAQKGGDELSQFARVAGMSSSQFKATFEKDAAGAIIAFIKGLDKINKNGGSAIKTLDEMGLSDIRMRDALLRASGASDVFTKALSIGNTAWDENTALTKEAKQRYETLESRIQIFKNTLKDIGISIYESANTPLGDMVKAATNAAKGLSEAFEKGGMQGLAKNIGSVLADAVTAITNYAPNLISAGAQTIKALVQGIYARRGEIVSAGGKIVMALASGIADMLPTGLGNAFRNLAKIAIAVAKPLLKIADHLLKVAAAASNVIPIILSTVAAMAAYTKITKVLTAVKAAQKALSAAIKGTATAEKQSILISKAASVIKTYQTAKNNAMAASTRVLSAATNKNSVATVANTAAVEAQGIAAGVAAVATKALSAAMALMGGPVGLAIAGIGALVGVLMLLGSKSDDSAEKQIKAGEKVIKSIQKQRKAYEDNLQAIKKQRDADIGQIDIAVNLKKELDGIVDSNGKVKKGYEQRAQFIAGQLKKATGIELSMMDGVIKGYGELGKAIDSYLEKKKAETTLKSQEKIWEASQKQIKKSIDHYTKLSEKIDEYHKKAEYYDKKRTGDMLKNATQAELYRSLEKKARAEREKTTNTVKKCTMIDKEYQQMYADFAAGNYEKINAFVSGHGAKMEEIEHMKRSSLEKTRIKTQAELELIGQLYDQTHNSEVKKAMDAKAQELNLIDQKMSGMATRTKIGGKSVIAETARVASNALAAAASKKKGFYQVGYDISSGIASGIVNAGYLVVNAAQNAIAAARRAARKKSKSHSPSKLFRDDVGMPISEGIAVGIDQGSKLVAKSASGAIGEAYKSAKDSIGFMSAMKKLDIPALDAKFRGAVDLQMASVSMPAMRNLEKRDSGEGANIVQNINIYQPVNSPAETAKAIRREAVVLGLAGR